MYGNITSIGFETNFPFLFKEDFTVGIITVSEQKTSIITGLEKENIFFIILLNDSTDLPLIYYTLNKSAVFLKFGKKTPFFLSVPTVFFPKNSF